MKYSLKLFNMNSNTLILAIIFLIILVYLPIGVSLGEGPLLASSSWYLGIGHPPGYSLYQMIGKLFLFLPFGNIAFRLTILSAICGIVTIRLLFILLRNRSKVATYFSIAYLFSFPTFLESVMKTEVYTLNLCLFLFILVALRQYFVYNDKRYIYLVFFIFGISTGHHLTLIILFPVVVIYLFLKTSSRSISLISISSMFFLLGCSILIYLPIRSYGVSLINWGNPQHIREFLTLVTASEEALPSLFDSLKLEGIQQFFKNFYFMLNHEFSIYLLIFILISMIVLIKKLFEVNRMSTEKMKKPKNSINKSELAIIFIQGMMLLILTFAVILYHSNESAFFYLPGFLIMIVFLAYGIDYIIEKVFNYFKERGYYLKAIQIIFFIFLFLIFFLQVHSIRELFNTSNLPDLEIFGRGLLTETNENSSFFTSRSSIYFLLIYEQNCEHVGEDRLVIFQHLLSFPWFLLHQYPGKLPIANNIPIERVVKNTQIWNDTISISMINQAACRYNAYVLEKEFFDSKVKKLFPLLHIYPNGFTMCITAKDGYVLVENNFYNWFSEFISGEKVKMINKDLYAFCHSQQTELFLQEGEISRAKREFELMKSLE